MLQIWCKFVATLNIESHYLNNNYITSLQDYTQRMCHINIIQCQDVAHSTKEEEDNWLRFCTTGTSVWQSTHKKSGNIRGEELCCGWADSTLVDLSRTCCQRTDDEQCRLRHLLLCFPLKILNLDKYGLRTVLKKLDVYQITVI